MVNNPFSNMFGQSPIRPMQQHIGKAYECAQHSLIFIDKARGNDWQAASDAYDKIAEFISKLMAEE